MSDLHFDQRRALPVAQTTHEEQEPNTLLVEDPLLAFGFVQLPKFVLFARNLSRDAKLLYAILLGYAWQEDHCFPGYTRLCADLDASENAVRKWMRELETAYVLTQRRRGLGLSNLYTLHDLRTAKIEVQEPHKTKALEPQKSQDYEETGEIQTIDRSIGERPVKGYEKTLRTERRHSDVVNLSRGQNPDFQRADSSHPPTHARVGNERCGKIAHVVLDSS